MSQLTTEQHDYITFSDPIDTKLIATAGSGKTFTIIQKMDYLIRENIYKPNEVLMLTFSKFTRDDFLNRIKKYEIGTISKKYIKTIDSFSKSVIDPNNEVDVSILSYKFMIYLENTDSEKIQNNKIIGPIKSIFVDEAQDLNETQYKILMYLKQKNNTIINLIGDPNQNIYQFRGSSDKYLTEFEAKTFYLTYNFRSHQEIVDFSQYLRPEKNINIMCKKKKSKSLPILMHYKTDKDFEENLISLLEHIKKNNNLRECAILSPTRGRMRSDNSNGLCFISNILYKNNIKFKQFYEESTDEINTGIKYEPEDDCINILTFMGSKGLEWKYTILIDAETCLINKRQFNEEKHKHDQYLLYVACSRAIKNLIIFSKFSFQKNKNKYVFNINPWFALIPPELYINDTRYTKIFEFTKEIIDRKTDINEKRVYKILDKCQENDIYELAQLCDFGIKESKKTITQLFNANTENVQCNIFLSKYLSALFFAYYNIINDKPPKQFHEIENIINLEKQICNQSKTFIYWYNTNKKNLTWDTYDKNKNEYSDEITDTIDKYFNRNKELNEHTIVTDGFYKTYILSNIESIKKNYEQYLKCKNPIKIRKKLFDILVIIYAIETQHYFHVTNNGEKFIHIIQDDEYVELFDNIYTYLKQQNIQINKSQLQISYKNSDLIGIIDFIDNDNNIYEIKTSSDISLKHIIQQIIYYIIHNKLFETPEQKHKITLNYINLLYGYETNVTVTLKKNSIPKIIDIFMKNK